MNRPVVVALVVAVAVVVVGAIEVPKGIQWAFSAISDRQKSASAFADGATAAITKAWDVESLSSLATPQYYQTVKNDGTAAWATYRLLGELVAAKPCVTDNLQIVNGTATAESQCPAEFKNGKASVELFTTDASGTWKITWVHVLL